MQYGDAGTDQGPNHLLEGDWRGRRSILRAQSVAAEQDWSDATGAGPVAFHRKKRELVHRIKRPQIGSELQTIDYLWLRSQTDMLRTEIAVPLN